MCGPPPDSRIYIEDVDSELIWNLQEWKKYTDSLQAEISGSERKNMKSVDCIEWFCSIVRNRLEEWSKKENFTLLFKTRYFRKEDEWMAGAGSK